MRRHKSEMVANDVRTLLRRHQEALNRHDVEALAAMYAADAEVISPMFEVLRGRAAIADAFSRLFGIFPDYTITTRDALFLTEGHRAAQFGTVTGTHRVELFGLPPTGQRIEYHAARLFTVADGLIVAEQRIYDFVGVLERLEKTRVDRELALASAVQQALVGQATSTGAFYEVVGASLPCRAISGDFLEIRTLRSGGIGLATGDVSGKGPAAAVVAAMIQGMFSLIDDRHGPPGDVVSHLNEALRRRGVSPRYATLFYGVLQPDGRFTYSNAGHPPPLLVQPSGVRPLTEGGPILGIFESATFPSTSVMLAPGDSVVCYSDGVTDAESPSAGPFGLDGLIDATLTLRASRPRTFVEGLLAAVGAFVDTAAAVDDATIAVLRFR